MYADEIAMIAYSTGLSPDNRCKITKEFRHSQIFHAKTIKNLIFSSFLTIFLSIHTLERAAYAKAGAKIMLSF